VLCVDKTKIYSNNGYCCCCCCCCYCYWIICLLLLLLNNIVDVTCFVLKSSSHGNSSRKRKECWQYRIISSLECHSGWMHTLSSSSSSSTSNINRKGQIQHSLSYYIDIFDIIILSYCVVVVVINRTDIDRTDIDGHHVIIEQKWMEGWMDCR